MHNTHNIKFVIFFTHYHRQNLVVQNRKKLDFNLDWARVNRPHSWILIRVDLIVDSIFFNEQSICKPSYTLGVSLKPTSINKSTHWKSNTKNTQYNTISLFYCPFLSSYDNFTARQSSLRRRPTRRSPMIAHFAAQRKNYGNKKAVQFWSRLYSV